MTTQEFEHDLSALRAQLTDTAGHARRLEEELKGAKANRDGWQAKAGRFGELIEAERKERRHHQDSVRAYERNTDGFLNWAKASGNYEARDKFLELMNTVGLVDDDNPATAGTKCPYCNRTPCGAQQDRNDPKQLRICRHATRLERDFLECARTHLSRSHWLALASCRMSNTCVCRNCKTASAPFFGLVRTPRLAHCSSS